MGEVLTLSFGQYANNTTTHLYNCQESQIPYTRNTPVNHNLTTFLSKSYSPNSGGGSSGGNANYYPRALVFELRGGLGALNKYEYSEKTPQFDQPVTNQPANPVAKNEYQRGLDLNLPTDSLLNTNNTKYWTDFNKLIYKPNSIITSPNFIHEYKKPGSHFNFTNQKYELFQTGQLEFQTVANDSVESCRYWLEKCDYFQGMQIGTTTNDAWGGFTTSMIQAVQDEFFNNNNKENIWIYATMNQKQQQHPKKKNTLLQSISEIYSFIELCNHSSVLFPIKPDYNSSLLNVKFDTSSIWHTSFIPAIFINAIWGVNSQLDNIASMSLIQGCILKGDESRKVVNEIKIVGENTGGNNSFNGMMMDVDLNSIKDWTRLSSSNQPNDISLGISGADERYFSRNYISMTKLALEAQQDADISSNFVNPWIDNILNGDTAPGIIDKKKSNNFYTTFNVHAGLRTYLKPYRVIIENTRQGQLTNVVEDKDELLNDISNLMTSYSCGFESDDDDFYD
ncbi:uncharacterized protein LODBEIA_P32120 [Lodderomyces beijingensis]|uniref:Protein DML1 n=1 Tax=Lodderomyces beijingensis TaxID=1775926 RepID=A0ABP0ZMU4_9ASCO